MPKQFTTSFSFPYCACLIRSNSKEIINLIEAQFPVACKRQARSPLAIHISLNRTTYARLPRSRFDCFYGFTLFYNRFSEGSCINLDVGPRTLRTIVDPEKNSIESYIATPPDFEKDVLFDLIFFQPLKCLLQMRGIYLVHASSVASGYEGVLFSGKSGSGKTTLALTLARAGFDFLTDEETVLTKGKKGVMCTGFPSKPKLKKNSLAIFPELKKVKREKSLKKDKMLFDYPFDGGRATVRTVTPKLLIFPRWVKTASTRLEPINKQSALTRLVKEEFMYIKHSSRHVSEAHFMMLAQLLRGASVYRLHYRDQDLERIPAIIKTALNRKKA